MLTLAIVGRPNVGKSTLFNRLVRRQMAIVDNTPGVTRDWRELEGQLLDRKFMIIDTAGLEERFDDSLEARMRRQTEAALGRADVILFVVDGREGMTPMDTHFARWLRRLKKPIILVANKCEKDEIADSARAEGYALGLGEPVPISAAHGIGMDLLYEALLPHDRVDADAEDKGEKQKTWTDEELDSLEGSPDFDFAAEAGEEPQIDALKSSPIRLAIVGRPNAGKSTLMNALLDEDRVMTGPEAGLTRDAIMASWEYAGWSFRLVDTAGLRKQARIEKKLEKMATGDTLRAIRLSQIVVLVVDALAPLEKQDLQIADHIVKEGRVLILAINKWDLVNAADRQAKMAEIRDILDSSLSQIPGIPFVTLSALRGQNLDRLMDQVLASYNIWNKRVSTGRLNRWLEVKTERHPPPLTQGRPNRLRYITQINVRPPTFAVWVSRPDDLPDTYKRYIVNELRKDYDLPGVPLRLLLRKSRNPYAGTS